MSIYAIGDIQGCYAPLQRLLDKIRFDPSVDCLWFAGDLVSRGTQSLETLRFVRSLSQQNAAISVLGNHDISLIAAAYGLLPPHKSLRPLMDAPDFAELLAWLRQNPLMHTDDQHQAVLVHAGIPPHWDLPTAQTCAHIVETELRQPDPGAWLERAYGNKPALWEDCNSWPDQHRYIINAFTRMRYCYPDSSLEFAQKLNPTDVQVSYPELIPWFRHPDRKDIKHTILFGHWSTLGYHREHNVVALDTGCVWGGKLTAHCIDTNNKIGHQVACHDYERREKG